VSTSLKSSDIVVRSASILGADVGQEFVALDAERGMCYSLNRVGSRVWQLISRPTRIETLCAQLVTEFNVDASICEEQTLSLLNQLNAEGLLTIEPDSIGALSRN
jgi:hypothetical protein